MKPSTALDLQRIAVRAVARRFQMGNLRVFGSVAMGTDTEGSDLDLLVDPKPGTTLFDLGGLQVELEELLGVTVDLRTPEDIPLKFRQQVLEQSRPV
ncbi:nucleotidyltransferase family protein [Pseudomonas rustica]|jgi:predicted nucleotidyltransferase|uniref:nucleotidyltransferase family protein n=1 Tax=Pseudomonas TaxID=286 RepID=UPI00249ABC65|nr:nucleotidyltransferase family protein [Pseudomonas sp. PS01303]